MAFRHIATSSSDENSIIGGRNRDEVGVVWICFRDNKKDALEKELRSQVFGAFDLI